MKYIEKLKKESRLEAMFIAHVVAYWVCVFVNIIKENLLDGFFLEKILDLVVRPVD
jgi:hypothetical protein